MKLPDDANSKTGSALKMYTKPKLENYGGLEQMTQANKNAGELDGGTSSGHTKTS